MACKVIGFSNNLALVLLFGSFYGSSLGCKAEVVQVDTVFWPTEV